MSFTNTERPFDDIDRQVKEKKAELELIQKSIDASNENATEIAKVEKRLKEIKKEEALASAKYQEDLEKTSKHRELLSSELEVLHSDVVNHRDENACLIEANDSLADTISKAKEKVEELKESRDNISFAITVLDDDRKRLHKEVADVKKALKVETGVLNVLKKDVATAMSEVAKVSELKEKVLKEIEIKVERSQKQIESADKNYAEILSNTESLKKERDTLTAEVKKLEEKRNEELQKLSSEQEALNQKLGEISFREKEMENTKEYLKRIIPALSEINPAALSKIDLSKI